MEMALEIGVVEKVRVEDEEVGRGKGGDWEALEEEEEEEEGGAEEEEMVAGVEEVEKVEGSWEVGGKVREAKEGMVVMRAEVTNCWMKRP